MGGLPVVIPPCRTEQIARANLDLAAGLILPGGFNVDAESYGEKPVRPDFVENADRQRSDRLLLSLARLTQIPVLAICYGMQMMNVHAGGSLVQDISTEVPDSIGHGEPDVHVVHGVSVTSGSRLESIVETSSFEVSSSHWQAVKRVGDGLKISATAPDGVIEAIEDPDHLFYIGVEWHPEQFHSEADGRILERFVAACRRYRAK